MTTRHCFLRRTVRAVVPAAVWRGAKRVKSRTRAVSARMLMRTRRRALELSLGNPIAGCRSIATTSSSSSTSSAATSAGHCLEFRDDSYTSRYGGPAVTRLDILHLDDTHPAATIVADLTKPNDIPTETFDCIVCTQVLHLIFEVDRAVSELWRILKPGGVLLATVPHISMCDPGWHEIWRFTPEGLGAVIGRAFGAEGVTVRAYGNSLTAAAELRGLVAEEFSQPTLDYNDPRFAVEVCARAVKSA